MRELKRIFIRGKLEHLILCEFYLVFILGYDNGEEESWNNHRVSLGEGDNNRLCAYANKSVCYHNHGVYTDSPDITVKQFLSQFV